MKVGYNGIFYVNNNIHCADDGVDHGDCSDHSEGADGIGVDDGDCSDLREAADGIGADDGVDDGDCSDLSEGADGVE